MDSVTTLPALNPWFYGFSDPLMNSALSLWPIVALPFGELLDRVAFGLDFCRRALSCLLLPGCREFRNCPFAKAAGRKQFPGPVPGSRVCAGLPRTPGPQLEYRCLRQGHRYGSAGHPQIPGPWPTLGTGRFHNPAAGRLIITFPAFARGCHPGRRQERAPQPVQPVGSVPFRVVWSRRGRPMCLPWSRPPPAAADPGLTRETT